MKFLPKLHHWGLSCQHNVSSYIKGRSHRYGGCDLLVLRIIRNLQNKILAFYRIGAKFVGTWVFALVLWRLGNY